MEAITTIGLDMAKSVLARRVISLQCGNSVAFGFKRTSGQIYEYTA